LAKAGRDVVLAVGSHSRVPRRYRGMDIYWWFERIGTLDKTIDQMRDAAAARREPSVQLAGRPSNERLDLGTLLANGVTLTGHLAGVDGNRVSFASDLHRTAAAADAQMRRVLADIDTHIAASGLTTEVLDADAPPDVAVAQQFDRLDLKQRGITTVLWAT